MTNDVAQDVVITDKPVEVAVNESKFEVPPLPKPKPTKKRIRPPRKPKTTEEVAESKIEDFVVKDATPKKSRSRPSTTYKGTVSERQELIFKIRKYFKSKVFGEYLVNDTDISHTNLNRKSMTDLQNIYESIVIEVEHFNIDNIFESAIKATCNVYEQTLSPFYDIHGFTDTLCGSTQFWALIERYKIETSLPKLSPAKQLLLLIGQTTYLQHQMNLMTRRPAPRK
jgi:hypothetical protein